MKMEILLEPTSNKLMINLTKLGNPVKKILLKLNLSDHRKLKDRGEELVLSDEQKKNLCLLYIEHMLLSNNKSLKSIPNMSYPTTEYTIDGYNRTSKTYLYMTMSATCRSQGGIILNVASNGIAGLLLEGGRTAHSRTMRDICRTGHSMPSEQVFGGKVVVFGGEFQQILSVVPNGSRQDCMQTRSSSRLVSNPSSNLTSSTNSNPKGHNRRCSKQRIEEFNLDELSPPIVTMADQRSMAQLLQAPTEGYEDAIVVPAITADNFELKHGLLTLVQNKQFFGHDKEDPHAHNRYFNKITSTLKFLNAPNTVLMNLLVKHGIDSKIFFEPVLIMPVVAKVSMDTSTSGISPDVPELKDMVKALLLDKKS
nr:ATP-dependent DNA helicase PIF2-like [Tanacetum cinerariifolium]